MTGHLTLVPANPSNRHVYERAVAWGAKQVGTIKDPATGADLLRMKVGSAKFVLAPPQVHRGNSRAMLQACYEACAGNQDRFWLEAPKPKVRKAKAKPQPVEPTQAQPALALVPEPPSPNHPTNHQPTSTSTKETTTMPTPSPEARKRPYKQRQQHIQKAADLMVAHAGVPMTVQRVAALLGIQPSQASGTLRALTRNGVVKRMQPGIYLFEPNGNQGQLTVRHLHDEGGPAPIATAAVAEAVAPVPAPAPVQAQAPAQAPALPDATMAEGLMADFLGMLFPQGFQVQHLAAIDAWRQATVRLIEEVSQ